MIHHEFSSDGSTLKLFNSYNVKKADFKNTLTEICTMTPDREVWNRGLDQMRLEWAAHNALYGIHIARSHTKDVDLNYPQNFFVRAMYAVVGCVVWIFIP